MIGVVSNTAALDTVGHTQSAEHGASPMPLWKAQESGTSEAVLVPVSRGKRMANSIRPLSVHNTRGAILPAERVRKLSPSMNVELMDGQEVFEQHANGLTS